MNTATTKAPSIAETLSARISPAQVGQILGFSENEVTILVQKGLLSYLGTPAQNGKKHFARTIVLQLAEDPAWLDKATKVVSKYYKEKRRKYNHNSSIVPPIE